MKYLKVILRVLLSIFMIWGGIQHFVNPDFYLCFIPDFISFKLPVIYLSGIVEMALGSMLLVKRFSLLGAWGVFLLMLAFLPIHIWDIFRENPAMGSHDAALIRAPFQLIFILWAWGVKQFISKNWNKKEEQKLQFSEK